MSVAVIIVNYNAGEWLLRSTKSALQDPSVTRVFVIDNASSDDSVNMLEQYADAENIKSSQLELIKNSENLGFGKANNIALQRILEQDDVQFALLLNPDCELSADVLPAMLPYFEHYDRLGMASCVITNTDGSIQSTCRRNFPTPWTAFVRMSQLQRLGLAKQVNFDLGSQPLPEKFETVEAISGAFMLVRLDAVKEVGVFDEDYFMHCEDLDWCKRFANNSWQVGFVPHVSVLHEKGVSSQSRPIGVLWNLHQGMLRFFDKFYRQQYSFLFRCIVRLGIYVSFFLRATSSAIARCLGR